ncbi:hypothetical protein WJX81_006119 [Elliptochloris bilobata]|uniref:Uncharacterized protein n=1 Tax=Elliptochloris bilobata TaxID=381761 RepID=A0AAW1QXU8_9CHLO
MSSGSFGSLAKDTAAHAAVNIEADGTVSPASELLFSFERSQSCHQLKGGADEDAANFARKGSAGDLQHIVALGRPATAFEHEVLEAVRSLKPACTTAEGFSVETLHAKLQAAGYIVELKHNGECAARSTGRRCLENLHHTYIVCRGSLADAVTVNSIVEAQLLENFEIGQPTSAYRALMQAAPVEFVGSPARLRALVEVLSAGMAATFAAQALPLPPWRRAC